MYPSGDMQNFGDTRFNKLIVESQVPTNVSPKHSPHKNHNNNRGPQPQIQPQPQRHFLSD